MALHKRKQTAKPEKSEFEKKVDQINAEISRQTELLNSLSGRIDKLIESDKKVHDTVDNPKPEDSKPEDPKPEDGDGSDKKDEHEEKIENA